MLRRLTVVASLGVLAGCSASIPPNAVFACSGALCPAGFQCLKGYCFPLGGDGGCVPNSCATGDLNCGEIDDGCGSTVQCGECASPLTCGGGGQANVCGCAGPTAAALCLKADFKCGPLSVTDGCGVARTEDCGGCLSGSVCAPASGGTRCVACVAESDAAFCARHSATCGDLSAADNCGVTRAISCGACVGCGADGGACCLARGQYCVQASDCCDGRGCFNGRCEATDGGI